jgi:thioredoxin-like negative regulator of GroEL
LWYGYYPVAQEVGGDTYNYYTYNYYDQPTTSANDYSAGTNGIAAVDETTFADVREKLARQKALEPAAQTDADTLFDEGVKAFEQGSYAEAEEKFARAMAIAPDDMILPFAYAQALLAQGKYTRAAEILRVVVQKSTPDKQGIFFPRGLYLDENTLDEQIDRLSEAAANNPADTDMQLLLGYQLLGIGETEKAIESLNAANTDGRNYATVNVLLDLAEKIKSGETK